MALSSVHFNRNILCAVDVETTGLIPGEHEIAQLAIIPLAPDLTLSKVFKPLELRIRPENIKVIDPEYKGLDRKLIVDCLTNGMERWAAVDYLNQWFYKTLNLGPRKGIVPLGCNYEAFDYPFITEFLGGPSCYREFFRSDVRDVQRLASSFNDLAEWNSERIPFPKVNLAYLCSCLDIVNPRAHDALHDAVTSAEVYRRMMNLGLHFKPVRTPDYEAGMNDLGDQFGNYVRACTNTQTEAMSFERFRTIWERSFGRVQ